MRDTKFFILIYFKKGLCKNINIFVYDKIELVNYKIIKFAIFQAVQHKHTYHTNTHIVANIHYNNK